ncbi:MAG TPA: phosphonate ABC transporter ATP-binding protein [Chthoniobacterales bacterium]|nr:phosphonate ABC transporter ATP-binding protein [Chthoniobacterales bacterium]
MLRTSETFSSEWAIEVISLSKIFKDGEKVLKEVSFKLRPGEMVALIGASGSGKSTLLRHLAGLTGGEPGSIVDVLGNRVQENGQISREIRAIRSRVGFIFQQFDLVGRISVLLNVLAGGLHRMPMWRSLLRLFRCSEVENALSALKMVGIEDHAHQRASTLSGGQQQRVAIARTLFQNCQVILADEPIASLDPESARVVMDLLAQINKERQISVLVSMHQVNVARLYCKRTIALNQGQVVFDGPTSALSRDFLCELYGSAARELIDERSLGEGASMVSYPVNRLVSEAH